MERKPCGALVAMGGQRVFLRMQPSSSVPNEGEGHLRDGKRCFFSTGPSICRWHPLGTFGATSKRCCISTTPIGRCCCDRIFSFSDVEKERTLSVSNAIYDNMCVPEIPSYIDYTQAPVINPAEDRKPLTLTAGTPPPTSSGQAQSTNNNFLHDGKITLFFSLHFPKQICLKKTMDRCMLIYYLVFTCLLSSCFM